MTVNAIEKRTLQHLEQALNLLRSGRHDEAMGKCKTIAVAHRDEAGTLNVCAQIAQQCGRPEAAEEWLKTAIALGPEQPEYDYSLGRILLQMHRIDEAIASFKRVLKKKPDYFLAYFQLGRCCLETRQYPHALSNFHRSIQLAPHHTASIYWAGIAHSLQGDTSRAVDFFEQTVSRDPNLLEAHYQLGLLYQATGKLILSRDRFRRVLLASPDDWRSMVNLCLVQRELGELASARVYGDRAITLKPDSFEAWHNLGNVYKDLGRFSEAVACYDKALALNPKSEVTCIGLGVAHQRNGDLELAEKSFQDALRRNPEAGTAICNLLNMAMIACDWDHCRNYAKRLEDLTSASLRKGELPAETPFVNLVRSNDPKLNLAVARAWSRDIDNRMAEARNQLRFQYAEKGWRKIRIGYLSNNFGDHPTAHITRGLYRLHDRSRFEISCFSFGPDDDSRFRRDIQEGCDNFFDIQDQSYVAAAKAINDHGVDILVDLVGFMKGQRMAVAALRPGPVQVRWLGMAGTSGATFFDYLITDPIVTPESQSRFYSEKFVYLPHCYQINDNQPYEGHIEYRRSDFGLPEGAFVFCCFNTSYKIDARIFTTWMNILERSAGSVIWLMADAPQLKASLRQAVIKSGIDPARLIFAGKLPKQEHLSRLRLANLALDTHLVNGAASTSDALWAGVPVLTVQGQHFASRMSSSIVSACGLPDLVTQSLDQYEDLAVAIATQRELHQKVETFLRTKAQESQLFNTEKFVIHLERAFTAIWKRFANGKKPCLIDTAKEKTMEQD